jgi:hypothetical protein
MTENERAAIREIAREIVAEIGPDIAEKAAWRVIKEHIDTCPVRTDLRVATMKFWLGVLIVGFCSGGGGAALIAQLSKF